jgi:acetyl esterase/lipase
MKNLVISCVLIFITGFASQCTEDTVFDQSAEHAKQIKDVEYGTHSQQTFDLYLPAGRSEETTKVVIMIHGGGWSGGDKNEIQNLVALMRIAWPEAAIVNMNYRLVTASMFKSPAQLEDIAAVIQHLKSKQVEYHISTDFALLGNSAGAHLSLLYAYAHDTNKDIKCVSDLYGPATLHDWSWYSNILIKPILENYVGATWAENENAYLLASPLEHVTATSPPTIIFHGTIDLVVPLYHSQWLNGRLNTEGVTNEYYEYFLDGHGFNATNNADCIRKSVAFFKANMLD